MDKDLISLFCCWPILDSSGKLRWKIETGLKHSLQKMLESKPGLNPEEALVIFVEQFRNGNDKFEDKHLQVYLCHIAQKEAREFYHNQFN